MYICTNMSISVSRVQYTVRGGEEKSPCAGLIKFYSAILRVSTTNIEGDYQGGRGERRGRRRRGKGEGVIVYWKPGTTVIW
jgi:hypothetical protein